MEVSSRIIRSSSTIRSFSRIARIFLYSQEKLTILSKSFFDKRIGGVEAYELPHRGVWETGNRRQNTKPTPSATSCGN